MIGRGRGEGLWLPSAVVFGALHEQDAGQVIKEHHTYPVGHLVRSRCTVVAVDDDDGGQDGHDVHDESEEQVLSN